MATRANMTSQQYKDEQLRHQMNLSFLINREREKAPTELHMKTANTLAAYDWLLSEVSATCDRNERGYTTTDKLVANLAIDIRSHLEENGLPKVEVSKLQSLWQIYERLPWSDETQTSMFVVMSDEEEQRSEETVLETECYTQEDTARGEMENSQQYVKNWDKQWVMAEFDGLVKSLPEKLAKDLLEQSKTDQKQS